MRTVIPKKSKQIPTDATKVFSGKIFDVYQWQQPLFDGSTATFEMLKRPDTTVVCAIKDEKLVVVHEEQSGHTPFFGFPGGRHDFDEETELQAAQREMLEETGMTFKSWKLVAVVQPQSKIDWLIYYFVADDFDAQVAPNPGPGEKIEVTLLDFAELPGLAGRDASRGPAEELLRHATSMQELRALSPFTDVK